MVKRSFNATEATEGFVKHAFLHNDGANSSVLLKRHLTRLLRRAYNAGRKDEKWYWEFERAVYER